MPIYYTYLIGWSQQNKFYYGCQYGALANPSNLWRTYFTSSNHVKMFRESFGEPDIIQVRKCFYDPIKAKSFEERVLLSIKNKSLWLNKRFGSFKDIVMTDNIKRKIKSRATGRKMHPNTKAALNRSNTGRKRPLEEIEKWASKLRGRKLSDEHRQNLSQAKMGCKPWNSGITHSTETCDKLKKSWSERPRVCRIFDRREMYINHFSKWVKLQPQICANQLMS